MSTQYILVAPWHKHLQIIQSRNEDGCIVWNALDSHCSQENWRCLVLEWNALKKIYPFGMLAVCSISILRSFCLFHRKKKMIDCKLTELTYQSVMLLMQCSFWTSTKNKNNVNNMKMKYEASREKFRLWRLSKWKTNKQTNISQHQTPYVIIIR